MPAIGDQVASLEHDHADALAQIDSLNATLSALTASHAAVTADNEALNKYADEIKAMVEAVAGGALKMLQAARAPLAAAVTTAATDVKAFIVKEVIPFAPPLSLTGQLPNATIIAEINAMAQNNTPEPPAQQAVAEIMAGDSGDESDALTRQAEAHIAEHGEGSPPAKLTGFLPSTPFNEPLLISAMTGYAARAETAAVADLKGLAVKIADVPEAVERMLHHSSAASTMIRRPVDMTMIVEHTDEGLPMFLRRGTAFDALARERVFG